MRSDESNPRNTSKLADPRPRSAGIRRARREFVEIIGRSSCGWLGKRGCKKRMRMMSLKRFSRLPKRFKQREHDRKRAKFRTWLFRSARNLIVHALAAASETRKGPETLTFAALGEEQPTPDSEDSRLFDQEIDGVAGLGRRPDAWPVPRNHRQAFGFDQRRRTGHDDHRADAGSGVGPAAGAKAERAAAMWDVETGKVSVVRKGRCAAGWPDSAVRQGSYARSAAKCSCAMRRPVKSRGDGRPMSTVASAFSPHGHLLAASDWNGPTLWNVATGERKQTITDHRAGVSSAVVAPDGATLATGSEDKTLRLSKSPAELIRLLPRNHPGIELRRWETRLNMGDANESVASRPRTAQNWPAGPGAERWFASVLRAR